MQIVSTEDNVHGMSNPVDNLYEMPKSVFREMSNPVDNLYEMPKSVFREKRKKKKKKKKTSKCYLLKILHRVLSLKTIKRLTS